MPPTELDAVNVAVVPAQTVTGDTVTVNAGLTVTVAVTGFAQPVTSATV